MKTLSPIPIKADREMLNPACSPLQDRSLVDRITAFFCAFLRCSEGRSHFGKNLRNASFANLSSVTTPNGLWVYTVVPWED